MELIDYFEILEELNKWAAKWENKFCSSYKEMLEDVIEHNLSSTPINTNVSKFLAASKTVTGFDFVFFKVELDNIVNLARYLDVEINVDLIIHRFISRTTFERGEEGILSVFEELKSHFSIRQEILRNQIDKLSDYEKIRLNEATYSSKKQCFFSSVINSVVSIEHRLINLMKNENESFLKNIKKDLRFSFGELIDIYLGNKEVFSHVIPSKYESLLKLCNSYRNFSAHAKEETMTKKDAEAILNHTFSFLLDQRCGIMTD
ncbi:hypothetical protein ES708_19447 [subsurface metagenome]